MEILVDSFISLILLEDCSIDAGTNVMEKLSNNGWIISLGKFWIIKFEINERISLVKFIDKISYRGNEWIARIDFYSTRVNRENFGSAIASSMTLY